MIDRDALIRATTDFLDHNPAYLFELVSAAFDSDSQVVEEILSYRIASVSVEGESTRVRSLLDITLTYANQAYDDDADLSAENTCSLRLEAMLSLARSDSTADGQGGMRVAGITNLATGGDLSGG